MPQRSALRWLSASRWVLGACLTALECSVGASSQHGSAGCPLHPCGILADVSFTSRISQYCHG